MLHPLRAFVCALCLVAVVPPFTAQPPLHESPEIADIGRPPIRIFSDKDGLPQNAITALAFDSKGYLWAGTKDGAAFYDGREWRTVDLPPGLGSTWIQCILVTSNGEAWFGTLGGGIARFDGKAWQVYDRTSGLPHVEVQDLIETVAPSGERAIVAATNNGVARFESGMWTTLPRLGETSDSNAFRCLYETTEPDGRRTLWAGTNVAGIGRFRDGEWTYYTDRNSGLTDARITDFVETSALDGTRTLVASTYGGELSRLVDGEWVHYDGDLKLPNRVASCLRETIGVDGRPVLWAGTPEGVARFADGRWEMLGDRLGLPVRGVWTLLDTPSPGGSRTLWIGTSGGGLARWEQGRWVAFDDTNFLRENSTYSLLETTGRDGRTATWIGALTKGLARYEAGRWTYFTLESGFFCANVLALLATTSKDGRTTVFVGSNNVGVGILRDDLIVKVLGEKEGLPAPTITALMAVPGADGETDVIAGTPKGLVRIHDDRLVPLDPGPKLVDPRVKCLLETTSPAGDRVLWVGTEGGLARFERGVTTTYDSSTGLVNDVVLSLLEVTTPDGRRELWAGTRGGGISRLDLTSPEAVWTPLTTQTTPALPNNTAYQMRLDAKNRIYVFTNKGVARLTPGAPTDDNPSPYSVYVFTTEDGLPSNECNTGASMVDGRGRIWAGTIGGVAVFDPSLEIVDPTPKPLVIERVDLVDTTRTVERGEWLAHDENHLVFNYTLLSYFRETDTRYQTQLVGFDARPSEWSADPKKEYTALAKGDYVFRVWARDAAGNVSGPAEIAFHIRPAPWATWWAYLLYVLFAAGLVYLAIRYRIRSLRRRNLALEAGIEDRTAELANKVEALRVSEQRALEASRAKSVFLANMSHELRTPLNAILGFVQLMERDRGLNGEQRENLGIIMRSGEHLLTLINDVLSLSKIEAGRATLDLAPFDLWRMLEGLEEMFRRRTELKGLRLSVDVDGSVPQFVMGDEAKLRQVLINLLGNAVKFTTAGEVRLDADWSDGRAGFAVSDTGPGMGPEEMGRLFKAFVQTTSGVRSNEGTGLGLAISRDYALLMDGDIAVESEVGVGSTFRVEIALPATGDVELATVGRRVIGLEPDQPPLVVLVVDDVHENRTLLRKLLTGLDIQVVEAANGREAVTLWAAHRPRAILMDVRMPVMDGIAATREIRSLENGAERSVLSAESSDSSTQHSALGTQHSALGTQHCTIIALTASAFEHDRAAILAAGCDDFVPKPFRNAVILEKLAEHAGVRFRYQDAESPGAVERTDGPAATAVTAERIAALPSDLTEHLAEAVMIGDVSAALKTIERIRQRDERLGSELKALVRGYQFDALLELLAADERR